MPSLLGVVFVARGKVLRPDNDLPGFQTNYRSDRTYMSSFDLNVQFDLYTDTAM